VNIRNATPDDAGAIARLVNQAYKVEAFFVAGDRTNADDVSGLMRTGSFLVVDGDVTGEIAACIYTSLSDGRAYFGMLAVDPAKQRQGLGRALIDECEHRARAAGARAMDIKVVNLRTDLLRRYERLGYLVAGTERYEHRPVLQPCHFIVMTKALEG
jgi:ribosomal protein S18 acetylase RimI-like enzyme